MPKLGRRSLLDLAGGASRRKPEDLDEDLGSAARQLVDEALGGLEPGELVDCHVHLLGLGHSGSGAFVNPAMRSWMHPVHHLKFRVYMSAAGIRDLNQADEQFVERLASLISGIPGGVRTYLLAFDKHYNQDGTPNLAKTEFYVPNEYVVAVAARYPNYFVATASVHPYREDALDELQNCAARGVHIIKWLPNAMGMDPGDPRIDPFYRKMKELGMTLLTHAGEEKAVEAEEDQHFGNPLLLRRPLELGVTVIIAHCASLGRNADLERRNHPLVNNFDLFLRLMGEQGYQGQLYGDISAMTQFNRLPRPLQVLLERPDLHGRLVNGSDYPLPAVNIVIRLKSL
ncbi:MAG TPA: amidohydrolase family protein, partial [Acidobacteriota bacterium]|nr:amidohydrolase family protein [Acidobacteriota bacterium]